MIERIESVRELYGNGPLVVDLTGLDRAHLAAAIWYLSGLAHFRFLKEPPLDFVFAF